MFQGAAPTKHATILAAFFYCVKFSLVCFRSSISVLIITASKATKSVHPIIFAIGELYRKINPTSCVMMIITLNAVFMKSPPLLPIRAVREAQKVIRGHVEVFG